MVAGDGGQADGSDGSEPGAGRGGAGRVCVGSLLSDQQLQGQCGGLLGAELRSHYFIIIVTFLMSIQSS